MRPPPDFEALRETSARLGADPLLVQGAGGNTSVKQGGVMWIKASGAWLADARTLDMFVPTDWARLRDAVARGDPLADQPAAFALTQGALRPSIETCLHALFAQRIVLHVHCVMTLALAVRRDARAALAQRLGGFNWAYVDYAKPGAELAQKVRAALRPGVDVVILGNHGLLVAGDDPAQAERLVLAVAKALAARPAPALPPDFEDLLRRSGGGYAPAPEGHPLHDVALRPYALQAATRGSLYPDHVVFCGPGASALDPAAFLAKPPTHGLNSPPFLLAPGAGAWLREAAGAGPLAMARCLGDVLTRVPDGVELTYLSDDETAALLDWDAEKYRQARNA